MRGLMPKYVSRLDILEAHYAFCQDYHGGMGCRLYRRMCQIGRVFNPGPLWKGKDSLEDTALDIYDELVARWEVSQA